MLIPSFELITRFVFPILLPISLSSLFIATRFYPGYSIKTHWISNLDNTKNASRPFFILFLTTLLLYGPNLFFEVSKIVVGYHLWQILLSFILCLLGFSILGIIFSPTNINIRRHLKFACLLLISIILFHIAFLTLKVTGIIEDRVLIILSIVIVALCVTFIVSTIRLIRKYKLTLGDLRTIVATEKSWLIRNSTLLEWTILLVNYVWIFYLNVILLS